MQREQVRGREGHKSNGGSPYWKRTAEGRRQHGQKKVQWEIIGGCKIYPAFAELEVERLRDARQHNLYKQIMNVCI